MKLNNKGFALTSIIYMLIVLFLMIMLLVLANLAQRKVVLDKLKYDVKEKLNQGGKIKKTYKAVEISYENDLSEDDCTEVQCALDELYRKANK